MVRNRIPSGRKQRPLEKKMQRGVGSSGGVVVLPFLFCWVLTTTTIFCAGGVQAFVLISPSSQSRQLSPINNNPISYRTKLGDIINNINNNNNNNNARAGGDAWARRMSAKDEEEDVDENDNKDGNDRPTGSFFNQVPPEPDTTGPKTPLGDDPFDQKVFDMLESRRAPPRASRPSTIGGVPTSKGFGKPSPALSTVKSYIGVGPPDEPKKPVNDVTKPEYDDQGYTLYQDEQTGEKSRVFEALVDYPCTFTMKIVGANEGAFVEEMVDVVATSCNVDTDQVPYTTKQMGKWTSVTVQAPVENAEMLYSLYENIDRDPRVKFKF